MDAGDGLQDIEGGGDVDLGGVQGLIHPHAVDGAHVGQAPLALAPAVRGPVEHEGVEHGCGHAPQTLGQRGQAVAGQLGLHEREVVGGVEDDDRGALGHCRRQGPGDLLKDFGGGTPLGARALRGDAVDGRRRLGNDDAGVRQPGADLLAAGAVRTARPARDERRGHEAVTERVHPGGLGVESQERADGPARGGE